ncbi:MAG: DinB family protein [Bacteroidia bacterium]
MKRRSVLGFIGLSPLVSWLPELTANRKITETLRNRWEKGKEYTLAVFDAMPEDFLEFSPTKEEMSFAQHFIHLGFWNNLYLGMITDQADYDPQKPLFDAKYLIARPDNINLFGPQPLQQIDGRNNKSLIRDYLNQTFDFVIQALSKIDDNKLSKGREDPKPDAFKGHTNLDMILRGEAHTAHHRAQAIVYLRLKGVTPPSYAQYNIL